MRPTTARRPLPGLLLGLLWASQLPLPGPAAAQESPGTRETLPAPVVLVLKLLSETHARPTTGVVISADGLVLVPADFVTAGDEIVVLDGGTDVFRNGRPARTVHRSAEAGVAVLAVDGLRRAPLTLAEPAVSGALHLAAFPPAEELAKGALPLWVAHAPSATLDALPNLPGPLLDRCGHLAGYLLPGEAAPRLLDPAALAAALRGFGLDLPTATCGGVVTEPPVAPVDEAQTTMKAVEPAPAPLGSPALPPDENAVVPAEAVTEQVVAPAPDMDEPPAPTEPFAIDAQTVAVTLATVLGLALWWWLRWRPRKRPASREPDTVELLPARGELGPALMPIEASQPRALLILQARLPDGQEIEIRHAVPMDDFDLTVGRAGDLAIDHASLSRAHARISGDRERLCISDLGSTNGTLVGPVPCLPGEVLHLGWGATALLGEVALSLRWHDAESPA